MIVDLLREIAEAGVVGAGGAGFPTHVKFQTPVRTFLVNAAECEPLLHKDQELILHYATEMISGLIVAMEQVGAFEGIIGIKEKYTEAIAALEPLLPASVRIFKMGSYYPAGDEFILIYEATGRIVPPGGLPKDVDCVVSNVETLINVARRRPVTHKYLTVCGAVAEPKTLYVPVGATMAECIAACGGATPEDWAILEGGVMMGRLRENPETPIAKTTGGIVVLPADHSLIARYRKDWKAIRWIARAACDQCTFCTEFCPRYLLGHPIQPHLAMRALAFSEGPEPPAAHTLFCCECNLCSLIACPEDLDPKNVCVTLKRKAREEGQKWLGDPAAIKAHPVYHGRRQPVATIKTRLGLNVYDDVGPLAPEPLQTTRVKIALSQHVGAPCEATVRVGDGVSAGQVIGRPPAGALGVPVHASIDGTVKAVGDAILIER